MANNPKHPVYFPPNEVSLIPTLQSKPDVATNKMMDSGFYFLGPTTTGPKITTFKPLKLMVSECQNDHFKSDYFTKKDCFGTNANTFFMILFQIFSNRYSKGEARSYSNFLFISVRLNA